MSRTKATAYPPHVLARPCPFCGVPARVRCKTVSGKRAVHPHEGRNGPFFACPRCQTFTWEETNAANGYCPSCQDWTGEDTGSAAQDVLFP